MPSWSSILVTRRSTLWIFLTTVAFYSSAEIHWFDPESPLGIACSHQHVEQALMSLLDFPQVRASGSIGKNDLPGGPGPQGPSYPLQAQRRFSQGHSRRPHLEPTSSEVADKSQSPQTHR